jgi:hypothetical protein
MVAKAEEAVAEARELVAIPARVERAEEEEKPVAVAEVEAEGKAAVTPERAVTGRAPPVNHRVAAGGTHRRRGKPIEGLVTDYGMECCPQLGQSTLLAKAMPARELLAELWGNGSAVALMTTRESERPACARWSPGP